MIAENKESFSSLINNYTALWLEWMKNYNISIDIGRSFSERRKAGENCENLISERYKNIDKLNEFFNVINSN